MSYQDPSQPPYGQPGYGQQPNTQPPSYGEPQYPPPPPAYGQQQYPQQPPQYAPPPGMAYGQPAAYQAGAMPMTVASPNGLALTSMIAGILSLTLCGFIAGIVAIITGHMGLNRAKTLPPQLARHGMAVAGLVMGYISVGVSVLFLLLFILGAIGASTTPSSFIR